MPGSAVAEAEASTSDETDDGLEEVDAEVELESDGDAPIILDYPSPNGSVGQS